MRPYELELRRIQRTVVLRRALLDGKSQVLARLLHAPQSAIGDAVPEMRLMVVGRAIDLLREDVPRALEVAEPHGREAAIEEIERRIGLELRQPALQGARFRHAS